VANADRSRLPDAGDGCDDRFEFEFEFDCGGGGGEGGSRRDRAPLIMLWRRSFDALLLLLVLLLLPPPLLLLALPVRVGSVRAWETCSEFSTQPSKYATSAGPCDGNI
jgi:hypothetical protein